MHIVSALLLASLAISIAVICDDIPKLREEAQPAIKTNGGIERINSKSYRGDKLILEQSVWRNESKREMYIQKVFVDGKLAIMVSRTNLYHLKSVGDVEPRPRFEEIDLDLDGDWDLLLFEHDLATEAFKIDADGFLTPVSSELLNEANAKIKEDSEWLLKHLAAELIR